MFTRLDEKGGNIYAPLLVCPVQQVSGAGMSEAYIDDIAGYVFESNAAGGLHPFTDDICLGAPEPTTPREPAPQSTAGDRPMQAQPPGQQACVCYCQARPKCIPPVFIPCCLSPGAVLASRELQMKEIFRDSLLCINGAPPKTQTMRVWCKARASTHYQAYALGQWVRVWRGQGNSSTIGWLRYTYWNTVMVCDISGLDCIREGCPTWTPQHFLRTFFPQCQPTDTLIRVRFEFRACRARVHS